MYTAARLASTGRAAVFLRAELPQSKPDGFASSPEGGAGAGAPEWVQPACGKQKLSPPRGCFRRKQARQLPFAVTTPPVKRQFWKIRRFSRIAK